jgi:hypothetical protein
MGGGVPPGRVIPDSAKFSVHRDPAWRDRANFIIQAPLEEEHHFEQLWVRQLEADLFEVCCIPFFLYDVALGDIVKTALQGESRYVMTGVERSLGRYVFRAFFSEAQYGYRDSVVAELEELGALMEWSSPSLVAIDAADLDAGQGVADLLWARQQSGRLVFETGIMTGRA